MALSIGGLAKTLPAIVPVSPATPTADDGADFGTVLGAATAATTGLKLTHRSPEIAQAISAAKKAIANAPPEEGMPIRNYPDPIKVKDDRQDGAADGKNEPTDDSDGDKSATDAVKGDDRKTIATLPSWTLISPALQPVILAIVASPPALRDAAAAASSSDIVTDAAPGIARAAALPAIATTPAAAAAPTRPNAPAPLADPALAEITAREPAVSATVASDLPPALPRTAQPVHLERGAQTRVADVPGAGAPASAEGIDDSESKPAGGAHSAGASAFSAPAVRAGGTAALIAAGPSLVPPIARVPIPPSVEPPSLTATTGETPVAKTPGPAPSLGPAVADGAAARVAAAPGLIVPIARVPITPSVEPPPAAATIAEAPVAKTPNQVPAPVPAAPTTGGALAAAAAHRALPAQGGEGQSGEKRDTRGRPDQYTASIDPSDPASAAGTIAAPVTAVAPTLQAAAAAPTADAVLDTRNPAWMATLVDKMVETRAADGGHAITMKLRPDALGAVEVSVRRSAGQLHVVFTAADPAARTLLADARSHLVTLAADRGVNLASATVTGGGAGMTGQGAGNQRDPRPAALPFAQSGPARVGTDDSETEILVPARTIRERTA